MYRSAWARARQQHHLISEPPLAGVGNSQWRPPLDSPLSSLLANLVIYEPKVVWAGGSGGDRHHMLLACTGFSCYYLMAFLPKGGEGKGLYWTQSQNSHVSALRITWVTLGTFQTNSQPGAFTGQTDVTFSKCFAKYCISCLRSFKMKFSRHPRIYLSTESNETCIKVLMR